MADCTYLRTVWSHGLKTYPHEIWTELDGFRFIRRRLEFYADGTVLWTSPEAWGGSDTGGPLCPFDELAEDPDCSAATMVTAEEFEALWAETPRIAPQAPGGVGD